MKPYLKIAAVTLGAFVIAVIASHYLPSASTLALRQYEHKYHEVNGKDVVSEAERRELEVLFREVNSVDNIKADLIEIAIKYAALFLVLVPLAIYGAKQLELEDNPTFAAAGLIFLAFILSGLMATGAIIGSIFFIASVTYRKKRAAAAQGGVSQPTHPLFHLRTNIYRDIGKIGC